MPSTPPAKSPNYSFLKLLDPALVALGAQAEFVFTVDPVACLFGLRLFGERLARELAAHAGIALPPEESRSTSCISCALADSFTPKWPTSSTAAQTRAVWIA
jgi:hypothetical protein